MNGMYRKTGAKAAVILMVVIITFSSYHMQIAKGDGVVTIYNAPPTFVTVKIQDVESRIVMTVDVSDYNGWEDIFRVYVNVTDIYGNIIESALYSQYPSNSSDQRVDTFSDLKGGVLIPEESDVQRFPYSPPSGGGWGKDWFNATYQRMTFVFKPFLGYRIIVTAYDRKEVSCEYVGPFSSQYSVAPAMENPTVPIGISLIVAMVAGLLVFQQRRSSNKLARLAEEKIGG